MTRIMSRLAFALCLLNAYALGMEVTSRLYDQRVDHLNAYNAAQTFKQRWYLNDTWWSGADSLGPIIFQIGGEAPLEADHVYGFLDNLAPQLNALVVAAEHRFYGDSNPFQPISRNFERSSDYLGLLSLEQAMADFMELLYFWKTQYFKCPLCPVIVLGGSYSGKLSFYLRLKYPQYFDMALAASAPIFLDSNGLTDPNLYFEIVTNATRKISPDCVSFVKSAFNVLVWESTAVEITDAIPLCSPLPDDQQRGLDEVVAFLMEQFADYSMGNYPPKTSPMKAACQRMENGTIHDGLQIWSRFLSPLQTEQGCVDLEAQKPAGAEATIHCSDLTGCGVGYAGESWDYQACTEVIQPLGTNNVTDMFPAWPFSMAWMDEHCTARFGVKASDRQKWLAQEFGLDAIYFESKLPEVTSRVIFSNGLLDGWSAGGNHANLSDTLIAIDMPNGAHHVDLRGDDEYDTQDVINARLQEIGLLSKWVKELQLERMAW